MSLQSRTQRANRAFLICLIAFALCAPALAADGEKLPENLAPTARISANSEYSQDYLAKFVADGEIPKAGGGQDLGKAWCVQGETHRDGAELTFEWSEPRTVADVMVYARTAWFPNECWKDYAVYADGSDQPVASGQLAMRHGPQRIHLDSKVQTRALRLKFASSYGGPNPGASEIQIFPEPVSDALLGKIARQAALASLMGSIPGVGKVDCDALRGLIDDLALNHGARYAQSAEHRARLDRLEAARKALGEQAAEAEREAVDTALLNLQRQALLFDVDRVVAIKRYEIEATHVYTYQYEGFRAGGGLYVLDLHDEAAEPRLLVGSPTGQILECDLSYDGKTVLFSWRQTEDAGYHVWTIDVDGTNLRQITDGAWHDYNACWLPDGGIAFLSSRSAQFAYCWHAPVGVVCRMDADGSNFQMLSANYLNDFTPYPLEDGRLIYSRWEYVDKPAIPIQSLWTVNPDGTNLSMYFGNGVLSPGTFMEARSIPGTTQIICTMTGHNGPTRGAIGVIDRSRGLNAQEAIRNITPDTPLPPVNQGNGNTDGSKLYSCPLPLDGERFLVSARGPVLARTIEGDCVAVALAAPDDEMQYFCAQPVRERLRPRVIPTILPPKADAGEFATVYMQDIYDGLEPHVKRGDVVRLRVVREMPKTVRIDPSKRAFGFQFPVISCGATYAGKTVLGEVPVAPDGSVAIRVPAKMPIYFIALDAEGRAVQRMRSFTHLMPGESQGCIGCHEHRLHAARPVRGSAYSAEPRELEAPEWGVRGFDYARIVQPVLDQYCVRCHDHTKAVDLMGDKTDFFNVSYDVLARQNQGSKGSPYVNWIPTYNGEEQNILEVTPKAWGSHQSKLARLVLAGHPDKDGKPRFDMDERSRRRILAWIDLNVPYYGSSETAYPDAVGCRNIYPADLDKVLVDVATRRCAECHSDGKVPRREWTRITNPERNVFLTAPLAKSAGGTGKCGKTVFADTTDADYRAILETFEPNLRMLAQVPRMDMEGGKPAPNVCRDTK